MSTVVVDVSELQSFDDECVKLLANFLERKLDAIIVSSKNEVSMEFEEGKEASRSCLRLLLRKFLHKGALKVDFRVISGGEDSFVVKERKQYVE